MDPGRNRPGSSSQRHQVLAMRIDCAYDWIGPDEFYRNPDKPNETLRGPMRQLPGKNWKLYKTRDNLSIPQPDELIRFQRYNSSDQFMGTSHTVRNIQVIYDPQYPLTGIFQTISVPQIIQRILNNSQTINPDNLARLLFVPNGPPAISPLVREPGYFNWREVDTKEFEELIESACKRVELNLRLTSNPGEKDKTKMKQGDNSKSAGNRVFVPPVNWASAPEFIPRGFSIGANATSSTPSSRSYAAVVGASSLAEGVTDNNGVELCPYAMVGECRFGEKCLYLHGMKCEFCGMSCLHPFDPVQREKHSRDCVEQHEKDMELSFAIARSSDKTCGICMEIIMEKTPPGEQRFGILPACNHCFCLSCIRKWRQARQFENKIIRACPECRITSDYVCPSRYWVETKEEKEKLIQSYLQSLSKKPCRYYRNGTGECPFGNKCFYLHARSDGTVVDVGPPKRRVRRHNANGSTSDAQPVSIWEFLEQWELQWFEIEDFMDMMDSDDTSNWSGEEEDDFLDAFEDAFEWDRN